MKKLKYFQNKLNEYMNIQDEEIQELENQNICSMAESDPELGLLLFLNWECDEYERALGYFPNIEIEKFNKVYQFYKLNK